MTPPPTTVASIARPGVSSVASFELEFSSFIVSVRASVHNIARGVDVDVFLRFIIRSCLYGCFVSASAFGGCGPEHVVNPRGVQGVELLCNRRPALGEV